jgi:hypothetical protein
MYINSSIITFLTDHCNNTCKYCSNFGCYYKEYYYDLNKYLDFFKILQSKDIHFYEIAITGGEPFLHQDIINYAINLRKIVKKDRIRISTNGFWIKNKNYLNYIDIFKNIDTILFTAYENIFKNTINNREVLLFRDYICKNFPNIYFRLEERKYMFPWEFTKEKIIRDNKYPCYLYNTCLGIDIYENKIYRCITMAKLNDIISRNKLKNDIKFRENYEIFYNSLNDSNYIKIDNNITEDKFDKFINVKQNKVESCYYCTYGEYNNLNKYFNKFDKLLPNNYNLKNQKYGIKWENI